MGSGASRAALTRRELLTRVGALGAASAGLLQACAGAPPASSSATAPPPASPGVGTPTGGASRRFAGTKLKVAWGTFVYMDALKRMAPEFERLTGISYELELTGFGVNLERTTLELSTGSSTYDVMQMVFLQAGKVVSAGWATDLTPYVERDKKEVEPDDFLPGSTVTFRRGSELHALPILADATMVAYRKDLFERAGYTRFPGTFDELMQAAPKIHSRETAFFVTESHWNWIWPNWLQAYGGNFFAKPPDDLTPTFNTDAAIRSADLLAQLVRRHGAPGMAAFGMPEAQAAVQQGRAAMMLHSIGALEPTVDKQKSTVADRMAFAAVPRGPAGWFPQMAAHGFLIPKAAKNKDAAWEFIKWATSKDVMLRIALENVYSGAPRGSVLSNPQFKAKYQIAGSDVPQLHLDVVKNAGAGYMAYRTIPAFPPIGDRVKVAISEVVGGRPAADAMAALQKDAFDILEKAGVKVR